jgi:phage FluMu gp28-like protein
MCRMLARTDPKKTLWDSNESELFIRLKVNGSFIWFKGADNTDSLYAEDVYAAVIDESTRCKDEAWHAIRSTITKTRGPVRIIGNVKGRKNWAYQLGQKAKAGDPNMGYHKLTAYDAVEGGVLDMEEIESAKRELPDAVFRELYLAEPSDDGANPFGIAAIRACVGVLSDLAPVGYGVDLAKSHDWCVLAGLDINGAVCRLERWQGPWGSTLERLKTAIGDTPALIDSTGVGDPIVEELQRILPSVEGYKFTSQSKQQLMEGLASAIQQQEITYPEGWLVGELESFEFEYTRTGVRYTAPEGLHDDGVCALALARRRCTIVVSPFEFSIGEGRVGRMDETDSDQGWSSL